MKTAYMFLSSPLDVSYIADNVLLLRYFEASGRIRKAISVMKKRTGRHEDTIRELSFDSGGVEMAPRYPSSRVCSPECHSSTASHRS